MPLDDLIELFDSDHRSLSLLLEISYFLLSLPLFFLPALLFLPALFLNPSLLFQFALFFLLALLLTSLLFFLPFTLYLLLSFDLLMLVMHVCYFLHELLACIQDLIDAAD